MEMDNSGNAPISLCLLFGRVQSSMTLLAWISLGGLGVFLGMGGYWLCLDLHLETPGLLRLWMLRPTGWRLLLAPKLERGRDLLVSSFLLGISVSFLPHLMSGLMVVWWLIRSLGLVWLGVVFMLTLLVPFGLVGDGVIWIFLPPLPDGGSETCRLYCSVLGSLQTVQRAEIWREGLVALQGCARTNVGVDNLNVVNHVSCITADRKFAQQLVRWRGSGRAAVTKVKGHADEGLVALGRVREVDRIGNHEADAAADLGRKRVHCSVTDARMVVKRARARWYLHRFFIAKGSVW